MESSSNAWISSHLDWELASAKTGKPEDRPYIMQKWVLISNATPFCTQRGNQDVGGPSWEYTGDEYRASKPWSFEQGWRRKKNLNMECGQLLLNMVVPFLVAFLGWFGWDLNREVRSWRISFGTSGVGRCLHRERNVMKCCQDWACLSDLVVDLQMLFRRRVQVNCAYETPIKKFKSHGPTSWIVLPSLSPYWNAWYSVYGDRLIAEEHGRLEHRLQSTVPKSSGLKSYRNT